MESPRFFAQTSDDGSKVFLNLNFVSRYYPKFRTGDAEVCVIMQDGYICGLRRDEEVSRFLALIGESEPRSVPETPLREVAPT